MTIEMHRWYAVIRDSDGYVVAVLASGMDGLEQYDSLEEYHEAYP